ncbi:MAG: ABC transporter substrate-binding protein [Puniceicoccales bacterium]
MKLGKFNSNWIAVIFLLGAFIVSAVRFAIVSQNLGNGEAEDAPGVVRVAHWQLEPGFREGLQWVMDEYNAQPHVQEAGIRVEQTPISERVYNQFMNVHLISGTAPDIAVKRQSELIKGNALAKFYTPLGGYTEEPNPYNAPEYQVEGLDPKLSKHLAEIRWKETFFDGLQGGYEEELSDYYAIPVSTWGGIRLIYNLSLLHDSKAYAAKVAAEDPQPDWMQAIWRSDENPKGMLPEAAGIAWLQNDEIPQTLGQLYLYCSAVEAYTKSIGEDKTAPISASNYVVNDIVNMYASEFLSALWQEMDLETGTQLDSLETLAAYSTGVWNFDSPMLKEFYQFIDAFTKFYPQGYLGLDREQAQRRFVLGKAAILATGGWDATSIYQGISARENPEDRFDVTIAPEPLPAPDERWADLLTMRVSEADAKGGVPFAINKQTKNFDWALDFLMFISSHRINEEFNRRAGWLPVITRTRLPEAVRDFAPTTDGMPKNFSINLIATSLPSTVRNAWSSQVKLYKSGDISYEDMAKNIDETLQNPTIGIDRSWKDRLQAEQDTSLAAGRAISVERLSALLGSEKAAERERANTYNNLIRDEGVHIRRWWRETYPEKTFPEYQ